MKSKRQGTGDRGQRTGISRQGERGFAMLIVFVFAAAVALMLYQQVPRVAFESQRDKEMLLIERGEQFKRAIQLYYVANKKWPAEIKDLENTNDKRYLRRRYVDPMTGKDEWRLVHTNGVMLTDSLVQKMPDPANDKNKDQLAGNTPGTDPNAPQAINAAVGMRPSDRTLPGAPNQFGNPQYNPNDPNAVAIALQQGGQQPGQQGFQPGQQGFQPQQGFPPAQQGLQPGQPGYPGVVGQPGVGQIGQVQFNPTFPGQGLPGQVTPGQMPFTPGQQFQIGSNGQPGAINPNLPGNQGAIMNPTGVINSQAGGVGIVPSFPGQQFPGGGNPSGFPSGGPGGSVAPNQAINMINDMLTRPRPAPVGVNLNSSAIPNNGIGLAGVASKYEGPSILVYAERQLYHEWEFVFDLKNNRIGGQQTGVQNPGGNRPGQQGVGGQQGIGGQQGMGGQQGIGGQRQGGMPPINPINPTRRQ